MCKILFERKKIWTVLVINGSKTTPKMETLKIICNSILLYKEADLLFKGNFNAKRIDYDNWSMWD